MWGIVPAAGRGSRIQPLAFSKELLPVGSQQEGGSERPRAVSEYLLDRFIASGVDKICFVIAPGKADILAYYAASYAQARIAYVVQPEPSGLCDAVFRAAPLVGPHEVVAIGLPDTVWFPCDALGALPNDRFSLLLFPVEQPQHFDSVAVDATGRVRTIDVKAPHATSPWIWGAMKMTGNVFHDLSALWQARQRQDEFLGTLINAYLAAGGEAWGVKAGRSYVDVGTLEGYRAAIQVLRSPTVGAPASTATVAEQMELGAAP